MELHRRIYTATGDTVRLSYADAETLRRSELTLHRWGERLCGYSNMFASYWLERDDDTSKVYEVRHRFSSKESERAPIPDLETGALRRVKDVCDRNGLFFYHQTDPRGCALYVSDDASKFTDSRNDGIACSVER